MISIRPVFASLIPYTLQQLEPLFFQVILYLFFTALVIVCNNSVTCAIHQLMCPPDQALNEHESTKDCLLCSLLYIPLYATTDRKKDA